MQLKYIIALDISKKSTGLCILHEDNSNLTFTELSSCRIPNPDNYNKYYFLAGEYLYSQIENTLLNTLPKDADVVVIFEYPIFGDYSSELQFYLTQTVLSLFHKHRIDCVGFSTMFLKSFIKQSVDKSSTNIKLKRILDKKQIALIYQNSLYSGNPLLPNPKDIKTDDEMDALYLALLGAYLVTPYLKNINVEANLNYISLEDFITNTTAKEILLEDPDYYNSLYRLRKTNHDPLPEIVFSKESRTVQFKAIRQSALKNSHLSTRSTFFFPFAKLGSIEIALNYFLQTERENTLDYLVQKFKSRKSYIDKMVQNTQNLKFGFNKKGNLFIRRTL